ncbi:DNA-methyltransferase [Herbaspirillum frisingense]|uniref:DNA-methyltransferase n=1 Tax=Herbaspirillum frisingense TaxID=92645 RepID=UPI0039AF2D2B
MPDESVHCVVTSPPYWALRDYGVDGQIGLEASPAEFIAKLVAVFEEVRRVLRADGTCWINMGDSYSHGGGGSKNDARWPKEAEHSNTTPKHLKAESGMKPKDLMMMPHRLAIALQDAGWWVRQDIVWSKPNPMPESVRDRCAKSHEYIFLLTKSKRYFFDQDAISEPVSPNTHARLSQDVQNQIGSERANGGAKTNGPMKAVGRGVGWGHGTDAEQRQRGRVRKLAESGSGTKNNGSFDQAMAIMPSVRNKRSVWSIATQSFKEAHFATFPLEIPMTCIKAGCPLGGVVLDPFFGAGTTGLAADRLQRDCIGIELNPEYAEMARRRIQADATLLANVQVAA